MPYTVHLRHGPETASFSYPSQWAELKAMLGAFDYDITRGGIHPNVKHHLDNAYADFTLLFRVPSNHNTPSEESDLVVTAWEEEVPRDFYWNVSTPLATNHIVASHHGIRQPG